MWEEYHLLILNMSNSSISNEPNSFTFENFMQKILPSFRIIAENFQQIAKDIREFNDLTQHEQSDSETVIVEIEESNEENNEEENNSKEEEEINEESIDPNSTEGILQLNNFKEEFKRKFPKILDKALGSVKSRPKLGNPPTKIHLRSALISRIKKVEIKTKRGKKEAYVLLSDFHKVQFKIGPYKSKKFLEEIEKILSDQLKNLYFGFCPRNYKNIMPSVFHGIKKMIYEKFPKINH